MYITESENNNCNRKVIYMIDFTINKEVLDRNIREARRNRIVLPTISQLKDPRTVPQEIQEQLKCVGMQEFSPLNLFRITWKNEPKESGGTYGKPNIIELPRELTGVKARIFCKITSAESEKSILPSSLRTL